ncbi:ATP-binding cassette subfamily C protein CydC [Natronocella acetinitrilica]|uniref:ATP-binding cassette subfamily C protein CydC n=1 Tax=Natronocella acetinitrilica TaxID=414046 RepID=A0AAE3G6Y7_9GAMM|nr:thiol reductant ABC exporter subunit CydC [Natronocella acetinitrilica]MCP1675538.1 ATP-binding cassette subfamily C protein CydC [Natronocella acetinitrilica]
MGDLRFFLVLLGRRRWWLAAGTALMLLTAAAGFGLLALSGWFITATGLMGLTLAAGGAMTLDIYRPGAGIRFFAVSRAVARYGERLVNHEAVFRILADLRTWLFRALLPQSRAHLSRFRDGELLNRVTTDINTLDHLYLRVIGPTVTAVLALCLGLAFIAWLSPPQAIAALLVLLPAALLVPWLTYRAGRPLAAAGAETASSLRQQVIGDLQAQAELHAFGAVPRRLNELEALDHKYTGDEQRLLQQRSLAESGVRLATLLALWAGLVVGVITVASGSVSGPVMVAVVLGLLALGEVLTPLPLAYQMLGRVSWSAGRLRGLADSGQPVSAGNAAVPGDKTLILQGVSFSHRPGQTPCLHNASLTLKPGERIGIVGPSGAGKSTMLSVLMGDLDPEHGDVLLGDTPLRQISDDQRQACFALLDQRATLFSASLAANLRLGRPAADEDELMDALAAVDLTSMVQRSAEGLSTWLGEAGSGLSGGQRRRLALARTLLKPAAIVLLDEPTEGLDGTTERRVLRGIDRLVGERSLIVIGHDPSRFPRMDRLLRLSEGRLSPL